MIIAHSPLSAPVPRLEPAWEGAWEQTILYTESGGRLVLFLDNKTMRPPLWRSPARVPLRDQRGAKI
jgi:hypothetical protein